MDSQYFIATKLLNHEAAELALDHGLFTRNRPLHRQLMVAKHVQSRRVVIATDANHKPVGVGLIGRGNLLYIHICRHHRRKGVGSMIAQMAKRSNMGLVGVPGVEGWDNFYKKNKIACMIG